jgi:hypothetical protein
MLIKLTNFRQLILFVSFLFSVICHSTVFYFLIYVFWFVFLVNITVSVQVFSTFLGLYLFCCPLCMDGEVYHTSWMIIHLTRC